MSSVSRSFGAIAACQRTKAAANYDLESEDGRRLSGYFVFVAVKEAKKLAVNIRFRDSELPPCSLHYIVVMDPTDSQRACYEHKTTSRQKEPPKRPISLKWVIHKLTTQQNVFDMKTFSKVKVQQWVLYVLMSNMTKCFEMLWDWGRLGVCSLRDHCLIAFASWDGDGLWQRKLLVWMLDLGIKKSVAS